MESLLTPVELRVLGCLFEKEFITPEAYPLSLAALTAACNQKSSREPVMTLEEAEVLDSISALMKKHLVKESGGAGSRVPKYAHRLSGTLDPSRSLSRPQLALLALLMLRGPQTTGELRTRSARLYDFQDPGEVEQVLVELAARDDGPYVAELPRQPGQRERRYMQLWSGEEVPSCAAMPAPLPDPEVVERVAALEQEVSALRTELSELKAVVEGLARAGKIHAA